MNCQQVTHKTLVPLALCLLIGLNVQAEEARELMWDELMPDDWVEGNPLEAASPGQLAGLDDYSEESVKLFEEFDRWRASAPVVEALDGQRVKIPGYVVPLEFEERSVSEFLLVPYFGACIHVPPPPKNQIVYVQSDDALEVEGLFQAVWVTGRLATEAKLNEVGDAGYTLTAEKVEPYEPTIQQLTQ